MAKWFAAGIAACLWCCAVEAQSVSLPEKIDVKAYRITEPAIVVQWDGDDAAVFSGSPDVVAFREYNPDPNKFMLRIVGYAKGSYNITVVVGKTVGGKTVLAKGTLTVNVDGGVPPAPTPDPVDPANDDIVDPKDPDYPSEIDTNLVRAIQNAASGMSKDGLKKLAKTHVLVADVVKNNTNTKAGQVKQILANAMQENFKDQIPESLATVLGQELNKVLPRSADAVMTSVQISALRKKLLSFARALNSTGK